MTVVPDQKFDQSKFGTRSMRQASRQRLGRIACWCALVMSCFVGICLQLEAQEVRLIPFDVDASPTLGTPMAYDRTIGVQLPLRCKGVVLLGSESPIVLCAVDWLGISNASHERFRSELARAAGTSSDRVAVHTLHQHDAPRCDGTSAEYLRGVGKSEEFYDEKLWAEVIERAAKAIREGAGSSKVVTHFGIGQAEVLEVASNRRMLDETGKVFVTRYTACKDPEVRALPVGVVDPQVRLLVFYQEQTPVVALTYFATHPQSYYRTGMANPDFPGMARNQLQEQTGVLHIHFNGAGGNVGAGKYNDGSVENRQVLADKVAAGMSQAWERVERRPLQAGDVRWRSEMLLLPLAEHLDEATLVASIENPDTPSLQLCLASEQLAFVRRQKAGMGVPIGCLHLPGAYVLHMPGELFVEYQLAASAMREDAQVLMAAYGDYGPFYVGTRIAYSQGGYETSPAASNVSHECEAVLLKAMNRLLDVPSSGIHASDFTETRGNRPSVAR